MTAFAPILTLVGALIVAWAGWQREDQKRRAEKRSYLALVEESVANCSEAFKELLRTAATPTLTDLESGILAVHASGALPALDDLVDGGIEKFPNATFYSRGRRVRDTCKRLLASAEASHADPVVLVTKTYRPFGQDAKLLTAALEKFEAAPRTISG